MEGYARQIEIMSDLKVSIKLGYWKTQSIEYFDHDDPGIICTEMVPSPNGKWCWYFSASNNVTDYKCPDGIYVGVQDDVEHERVTVVNCYGNHLIYRSPMHQHEEDGLYTDYKENVSSAFLEEKT